jgi:hypothetical protein
MASRCLATAVLTLGIGVMMPACNDHDLGVAVDGGRDVVWGEHVAGASADGSALESPAAELSSDASFDSPAGQLDDVPLGSPDHVLADAQLDAAANVEIDASVTGRPLDVAPSDSGFLAGEAGVAVAVIVRSGNSQRPGATTTIYADGSAVESYEPFGSPDGGVRNYPPGSPLVVQFLLDLSAVGDITTIPIQFGCAKSVSFGTTLTLSAGGKQTGDLECAHNPTPDQKRLIDDCLGLTS